MILIILRYMAVGSICLILGCCFNISGQISRQEEADKRYKGE